MRMAPIGGFLDLFLICSWRLWLSNHLTKKKKQKGKCSLLVLWDQLASGLVSSAWNGQKMVNAFSKISLDHELILLSFAPSKRLQTSSWLACAYNSTSMAFSKERCRDDKDLQLAILISQGWGKPCSHAGRWIPRWSRCRQTQSSRAADVWSRSSLGMST